MGLKNYFIRREGKKYMNLDFVKRNKKWIGFIFFAASGYTYFKCPGLTEATCILIIGGLSNIGSFLTGAGILPSDYRETISQGIPVSPEGPSALDKLA